MRRMRKRKSYLSILPPKEKLKRPFRHKMARVRPKYGESNWARLLLQRHCEDPATRAGKLFRRRFRVPFPVFADILKITKEKKWFKEFDGIGRPACPIELKIFGVLRILGRGMCFDGISELTNIDELYNIKLLPDLLHSF